MKGIYRYRCRRDPGKILLHYYIILFTTNKLFCIVVDYYYSEEKTKHVLECQPQQAKGSTSTEMMLRPPM